MVAAYGYVLTAYKDFWWWDTQLFWQRMGRAVSRTVAWERRQDQAGYACMGIGAFMIFYALVLSFIS